MTGDHFGHGPGVLHEDWITWKPTRQLMQNMLALRAYRVMVRPRLLPLHLKIVLLWHWLVHQAKEELFFIAAISVKLSKTSREQVNITGWLEIT